MISSVIISFFAFVSVVLIAFAFIMLGMTTVLFYLLDIFPCNYLVRTYWDKQIDFWFYFILILAFCFFLGIGTLMDYWLRKYVGNIMFRLILAVALQVIIICLLSVLSIRVQ